MTSIIVYILITFVVCTFEVAPYEILSILPCHAFSHFWVFHPVMKELAKRGHNVTVLSYIRTKDQFANYKEIAISEEEALKGISTFEKCNRSIIARQHIESNFLFQTGLKTCEDILKNEEAKNILRGDRHFDLIIAEQFNTDCAFVFLHKLKVPFVAMLSDTLYPYVFARAGVPNNPSYIPNRFLQYGRHPNFIQRVLSTLSGVHNVVTYRMGQLKTETLIKSYMEDFPSLDSLTKNTSLFLVNSHPVLYGADALPPNVINIGGVHTHNQRKPLPIELDKFIKDSTHGVIYVSFGSMVKGSSMPQNKLNAFLEAFAELPQRILLKWENESLPGAPANLLTKKWMPQLDILSNENVKVFISHGGMLGTIEAIHAGVPTLIIPVFSDQFANSATLRDNGLGLTLLFEEVSKDSLLKALRELLEPKMYQNAKRLSQIWHDRPMSPMDTAIYWIEYVARHGGAPHLRSAAVDLPLYQYLLLDVITFLTAISVMILYINYRILILAYRCFFGGKRATSNTVSNKSKRKKTKKE